MNETFQLPELRRVTVFVGAYGSGKSEISVNFALWQAEHGAAVTLCDLDIINPYFRSADARELVQNAGIRLIAPLYAGTNVDVPAVPGEVHAVFDDDSRQAILDIGGEDLGARVLASLHTGLAASEPAIYMVVNPFRPFTGTPGAIARVAGELSAAADLPLTGLVHNANLLGEGGADLLSESWPIIRDAAALLDLPVVFAAAMAETVPAGWGSRTPQNIPLLRLRRGILYRA